MPVEEIHDVVADDPTDLEQDDERFPSIKPCHVHDDLVRKANQEGYFEDSISEDMGGYTRLPLWPELAETSGVFHPLTAFTPLIHR